VAEISVPFGSGASSHNLLGLCCDEAPDLSEMASTRALDGNPRKSNWTTAGSWFSNTPEDPDRLAEKADAERILGKAAWRATITTNEHRYEFSRSRPISAFSGAFFLSAFQLYQVPPFPPQPPFPRHPVRPNGSFRDIQQKANS
jgi:hypothetical protein